MVRDILRGIQSALTWWVSVAPWEQAIRVRAGKHVKLLDAGIHLRVPILDRVYRQSTRLRVSTLPSQVLTTASGKALTLGLTLSYRITDLRRLYESLHHAEGSLCALVLQAAATHVRAVEEVSPADLCGKLGRELKLEQYGLAEAKIGIANYAVVRTYRLITGDAVVWSQGDDLNTDREWSPMASDPHYQ